MEAKELWPKKGKLKKAIMILVIVLFSVLAIALMEEKTNYNAVKKLTLIVAVACLAVWFYLPHSKESK